jgi:hypothetical protein
VVGRRAEAKEHAATTLDLLPGSRCGLLPSSSTAVQSRAELGHGRRRRNTGNEWSGWDRLAVCVVAASAGLGGRRRWGQANSVASVGAGDGAAAVCRWREREDERERVRRAQVRFSRQEKFQEVRLHVYFPMESGHTNAILRNDSFTFT